MRRIDIPGNRQATVYIYKLFVKRRVDVKKPWVFRTSNSKTVA
jgi:hypothetical protein